MRSITDSYQEPKIEIGLLELLRILQRSTKNVKLEVGNRIASEVMLELNKRGHIDSKTLGDILGELNPGLRQPEKIIVATRTVPYSWPEEIGKNGLIWRDSR
jgi:hypothetical protein